MSFSRGVHIPEKRFQRTMAGKENRSSEEKCDELGLRVNRKKLFSIVEGSKLRTTGSKAGGFASRWFKE